MYFGQTGLTTHTREVAHRCVRALTLTLEGQREILAIFFGVQLVLLKEMRQILK